jgi:hypothetical protein
MKNFTHHNINKNLTFENVYSCLLEFWMNESKNLENKKIWLTIIVLNKQDKSIELVNNLPFLCFTDVVIVLKQMLICFALAESQQEISNNKNIIKDIVFQYYIEENKNINKHKYNWNKFILYGLIYIILLLCIIVLSAIIYIFYLEISQALNCNILTEELMQKSTEIIKEQSINISTRRFCFEPFVKLFYQTSTSYAYFPSHFLPSELKVDDSDFNLLEYILYNQYLILDYQALHMEGLNDVLKQYQSISSRILL